MTAADRPTEPGPGLSAEVVTEAMRAQVAGDAEALEPEPAAGPGGQASGEFDTPDTRPQVGRLVDPDQGSLRDTEKDLIAADHGEAGGGAAPEEAAMHEVDEDEVPDQR